MLADAIHKAGGISDANADDLSKISWARAARTDKGVSAACNVVSLKMVLEPPGIIERINQHLPDDIEAFGYVRVTNKFDARKLCDRRRYGYVLPLWALDTSLDRVKVAPGEKVEELVSRFGAILRKYEGTHNFHSFTKNLEYHKPQAKRYILKWDVNTFELNGHTFVKCEVLGQSFLYHQIRKMVGLAVAISRGVAPENCLMTALKSRMKFNVPVAPEFPLYLEECIFNSYNKKWEKDHDVLSRNNYLEKINNFKRNKIDSNIIASEDFHEGILVWIRGTTNDLHHFSEWEEQAKQEKMESRGRKKYKSPEKREREGDEEEGGSDRAVRPKLEEIETTTPAAPAADLVALVPRQVVEAEKGKKVDSDAKPELNTGDQKGKEVKE